MTVTFEEENEDRKIRCILCHAYVFFPSLPPKKYTQHLRNNHDIHFEIDRIIETTLQEQFPNLANNGPILCKIPGNNTNDLNNDAPKNTISKKKSTNDNTFKYLRIKKEITEDYADDNQAFVYSSSDDVIASDAARLKNEGATAKEERISKDVRSLSSYEEWKTGHCQYKCNVCDTGNVFNIAKLFFDHIEVTHKMSKKDYWDCYGNPCIKEVFIICGICNVKLRHDLYYLEKHIEKNHKVSLSEYYGKFVQPKQNDHASLPDIINNLDVDDTNNPEINIEDDDDDSVSQYDTDSTNIQEPIISLEVGNALDENEDTASQLCTDDKPNDGLVRVKWDCGALYGCKLCTRQFFELPDFKRHLSSAHDMDINLFTNKYGEPILVNNFHECLICGRGMLHCPSTIRNHLVVHNLTPSTYYEKFKKEIDEENLTLPITDEELLSTLVHKRSSHKSSNLGSPGMDKSRWINRCIFTCKVCSSGVEFDSYCKVRTHIISGHNMSFADYTKEHGNPMSKVVWHTCQICWVLILWRGDCINTHIQKRHNISKMDYHNKYMSSYSSWPSSSYIQNNTDESAKDENSNEWMNQCTFQCFMCPKVEDKDSRKTYYNYAVMMEHVLNKHHVSEEEYSKRHGSPLLSKSVAYHLCQLCDKKVLWNKDCLNIHFTNRHSISPTDYQQQFKKYCTPGNAMSKKAALKRGPKTGIKHSSSNSESQGGFWSSRCKFKCRICFSVLKSKTSTATHCKSNHNMTVGYHEDHFGELLFDKTLLVCQICFKDILWDGYYIQRHLEKSHKERIGKYKENHIDTFLKAPEEEGDIETAWMNQCEYNCRMCSKTFNRQENFSSHLKSDHDGIAVTVYKQKFESFEYLKKYHYCQVDDCQKEVLWEVKTMTRHISSHNLTPESYKAKFMSKYEMMKEEDLLDNMNKCSFVCRICLALFNIKQELIDHVKEEHEVIDYIKDYQNVHGDSVAKKVVHSCAVCSQNLLWDKETIINHVKESHNLNAVDYAKERLEGYKENTECQEKQRESSEWLNQCVYECVPCSKQFNSFEGSQSHIYNPKGIHNENKDKVSLRRTAKKLIHTCQICGAPEEWDNKFLKYHFKQKHGIQADVYYAKYMSNYTTDLDEIKNRQKANKLWKKKQHALRTERRKNSENDEEEEEEEYGEKLDEIVKKWAAGCLYYCEICDSDYAGLRSFSSHLAGKHRTSFSKHLAKYQMRNVCILKGYVWCKLCQKNVTHDEVDLKKHFKKEHNISISEYYERFKSKLRMPRLERPESFRANSKESDTPNDSLDHTDAKETSKTVSTGTKRTRSGGEVDDTGLLKENKRIKKTVRIKE